MAEKAGHVYLNILERLSFIYKYYELTIKQKKLARGLMLHSKFTMQIILI